MAAYYAENFMRRIGARFLRCHRLMKLALFASFVLYCHFMFRTYETVDGLSEASRDVLRVEYVIQSSYPSSTTHAPLTSRKDNTPRIWPRDDWDTEDRLLNQLEYAQLHAHRLGYMDTKDSTFVKDPVNETVDTRKGLKLIYSEIYGTDENRGRKPFLRGECPISACYLIQKTTQQQQRGRLRYDAVLTSAHAKPDIELSPGGVVIWFQLESPQHSSCPSKGINWTATYRRASTLRAPYEFFAGKHPERAQTNASRNYARGKSKIVAIFMSNCRAKNNRSKYLAELQRYVDVDVYGSCGPFRCSKRNSDVCFRILNKDYKFYLAFENSNCRDYITEKFFINGLSNDIVPVVMGAHPDDYRAVAPPHSYIHVDDFESPRHLADYLKLLDQNDTLYNEYFAWKGTGTFINTKFWCRLSFLLVTAKFPPYFRLCAMLHARDKTNYVHTYKDLFSWWNKDQCVMAGSYGATWRTKPNTTTSRYSDKMTSS
ncbi:hypothetical protein LSH36_506g01009 [Paralvinella palmiformis]|uniref:Fucosyltransferase n=1 Tax=Paralvinella palmiformis TaxID=53620 RepID=A0AAD9MXX2_9ANNE|nr:hypothetical protein LSH36_506g01009 [Paralvinella palmiformis]